MRRVPTAEEEAARDLVRAGEDVRADLMRSRVPALLLRRVHFDDRAVELAYEAALATVFPAEDRRGLLDKAIAEAAQLAR